MFARSKRSASAFTRVAAKNPKADALIFLGDGCKDLEKVQDALPMPVYPVHGNCDFGADLPDELVLDLGGARIFCMHGHNYNVKSDLYRAVCAARARKAGLLLFGHTHQPLEMYDDGLYILNPGSASGYRASCALVDISEAGILTNIIYRN